MLVNDQNFAVHYHVVFVALEQRLGANRVVEERNQRGVSSLVEVADAEVVFDLLDTRLKDAHGALLFVNFVVDYWLKAFGNLGELGKPAVGIARGRARDDQRGARFIDEDGVNLVNDGKEVPALN